jgi:hypothetical protein
MSCRINRSWRAPVVRTLAAAPVVAMCVALIPGPASAATSAPLAAPPAATSSAGYGAGWLARQITANGGYLTNFGSPDLSDTAYAVVGLQAAGVGQSAITSAMNYLVRQVPNLKDGGADNPGRLADVILAGTSAGKDVRHFGGKRAQNDLVARLLATARTSGRDKGLFGAADPKFDGASRQGLALAALAAAKVPSSNKTVASAINWLARQQCANGLWVSYRSSVTTSCPAADPNTFTGPDTNSTGLAAQGLAAYGKRPRQSAVLASLARVQSADGGFSFIAAPGQTSDPNSTALTIQAILAERGDPQAARWHKGHRGPYAALSSYQLGCSAPAADRGAFFFPGSSTPNVLATVQAVPAAAGKTLPVAHAAVTKSAPSMVCATTVAASTSTNTSAPVTVSTAGRAGPCPGKTGVTVAVDLRAFGKGLKVRCNPGKPTNGIEALRGAGFTVAGTKQYGLAFVCRINGLPTVAKQKCISTPPVSAYWAYYHGARTATRWTYQSSGPLASHPAQGSVEGWAFGASAKPSKTPAQIVKR